MGGAEKEKGTWGLKGEDWDQREEDSVSQRGGAGEKRRRGLRGEEGWGGREEKAGSQRGGRVESEGGGELRWEA